MSKVKILRGEDRILTLRVTTGIQPEPYDLSGVTRICVFFRQEQSFDLLEVNSDTVSAVPAQATKDNVIFTADTPGAGGNTISLVFNGSDTIDTVVTAWNMANPGNTVSHNGTGTDILSAETLDLGGGRDAYVPVSVLGNAVLGKIQVQLTESQTLKLRVSDDQDIKVKLDMGDPVSGERRLVMFRRALDVEEGSI